MLEKTTPDTFAKAITDYLEIYVEDIQEDVEETADLIGKEAKNELKEISPRSGIARKNKYYAGWAIKKDRKGKSYYTVKVWNRTNYQLTHLLEFGHATRNGGRTRAIPHIRPVEEKYSQEFLKKLDNKIRRAGK